MSKQDTGKPVKIRTATYNRVVKYCGRKWKLIEFLSQAADEKMQRGKSEPSPETNID